MKYIKTLEKFNVNYNVGDLIILTEGDEDNAGLCYYFEVGNMYKIHDIDYMDPELTYNIIQLNNHHSAWVSDTQIRKLNKMELDQIKYNL